MKRGVLVLLAVVGVSACRSAVPQPTGVATHPPPLGVEGSEAPEACGFAEGAGLSFAGRSTTAALNIQEVAGEPMSDEPADVYVTRDEFVLGQHLGRFVCVIFVDPPSFGVVTVHPEERRTLVADPHVWVTVAGPVDREPSEALVLEIGDTAWDAAGGVTSVESADPLGVRLIGQEGCLTLAWFSADPGTTWVIRFDESGFVMVEDWTGLGHDDGPSLPLSQPSGCPPTRVPDQ